MSKQDWIIWNGGRQPVPNGTIVDVMFRDDEELSGVEAGVCVRTRGRDAAGSFWKHDDADSDIVAYRIVAPAAAKAPRPHTHAARMLAYAEDAARSHEPWLLWQFRTNPDNVWDDLDDQPVWGEAFQYRRKPSTRVINGFEVPAPEVNAPEEDTVYWMANAAFADFTESYTWRGDNGDLRFLTRGLVFRDKASAAANGKAMVGIDPMWSAE